VDAFIPDVSSISESGDGYCVIKLAYTFGRHSPRSFGKVRDLVGPPCGISYDFLVVGSPTKFGVEDDAEVFVVDCGLDRLCGLGAIGVGSGEDEVWGSDV